MWSQALWSRPDGKVCHPAMATRRKRGFLFFHRPGRTTFSQNPKNPPSEQGPRPTARHGFERHSGKADGLGESFSSFRRLRFAFVNEILRRSDSSDQNRQPQNTHATDKRGNGVRQTLRRWEGWRERNCKQLLQERSPLWDKQRNPLSS